ncbi:hypothetical protein DPM35_07715 [Mesorhizobium atlanticum]|uniref:Uncharacterized protein n=1 Tax=Mesorhizobium atlanticum TaxID=2233532 RepID=A0A330GVI2_9HYPH|nr:hypothetical protein DPM35_07715 [Mesorhizobium atlanticum]
MAGSLNDTMLVRAGDDAVGPQDMFNKELQTYHKIVGANLIFHRPAPPRRSSHFAQLCGDADGSAMGLAVLQ